MKAFSRYTAIILKNYVIMYNKAFVLHW